MGALERALKINTSQEFSMGCHDGKRNNTSFSSAMGPIGGCSVNML